MPHQDTRETELQAFEARLLRDFGDSPYIRRCIEEGQRDARAFYAYWDTFFTQQRQQPPQA